MAALAFGSHIHADGAFFRNADDGGGLLDAGEYVFYDSAAFIQHKGGLDTAVLQLGHDGGRVTAEDFLVAAKGEVYVVFRLEALSDKQFGSLQNAVHGAFGVQCAAAPQFSIYDGAGEGRLLPLGFLHGHHIVVGHQNRGHVGGLARPVVQHATAADDLPGAGGGYVGIGGGQVGLQLGELLRILQRCIHVGDGAEADQVRKTGGGGFIHGIGSLGNGRFLGGLEGSGTDQQHGDERRKSCQKDPQNGHCASTSG